MSRSMSRRLAALLFVAHAVSVVVAANDQDKVTRPRAGAPGEWRLIGQVTANLTADHDVIVVAGPFDDFRRIKFKVTDAPLNITRPIVTYDNGEPQRLDVRYRIPQGGESRAIDLRGAKRSIRKIEFWYDTAGVGKGRADVTVFGMK
jgi:hypothetical protein